MCGKGNIALNLMSLAGGMFGLWPLQVSTPDKIYKAMGMFPMLDHSSFLSFLLSVSLTLHNWRGHVFMHAIVDSHTHIHADMSAVYRLLLILPATVLRLT